MDGRNNINRAPTGIPSSPSADFNQRDDSALPTAFNVTMPTYNYIRPSQPAYYPPPGFDFAPSQTFGHGSYPEPTVDYSLPYPRSFTPTYSSPAVRPQPPQPPVARSQSSFQSAWPEDWDFFPIPPPGSINPVVIAQPTTYSHQLPARSELPPASQLIQGLFGDALPQYVNIFGPPLALDQLREAINVEKVMVEGNGQDCNAAFIASLRHLQDKGAITDPDKEDTGRGRFTLHEMSETELQSFGIDPSDFEINPMDSVQHFGNPPFQGNVDYLLGFLRVMAKYHDYSHGTSYQLGIVSKTGYSNYTAQIFKARGNKEVGATMWIYRECIGDYTSADRWTEFWHAFVRRPDAPPPIEQLSVGSPAFFFPRLYQDLDQSEDSYAISNINASSNGKRRGTAPASRGRGRPRKTTHRHSMPATQPMLGSSSLTHGIPDRSLWPGARHQQDNAHLFQNLTDEEILSGSVHPDDIVGTLMLRLVPNHSNTELHQKINALYYTLNPAKPKTVTASSITKRWTLALQHICKRDGLDRQAEMDRYHGMRQANGILGGTGGGEGPPASKKLKASRVKAEEDEAFFKRDELLDADFETGDENSAIPPAGAPTRRRRTRKSVNCTTLFEQLEDVDESDEHESGSEKMRPAKRRKRDSVYEEDMSEFEEENIKDAW